MHLFHSDISVINLNQQDASKIAIYRINRDVKILYRWGVNQLVHDSVKTGR